MIVWKLYYKAQSKWLKYRNPDKNPAMKQLEAEAKFKQISKAYDLRGLRRP